MARLAHPGLMVVVMAGEAAEAVPRAVLAQVVLVDFRGVAAAVLARPRQEQSESAALADAERFASGPMTTKAYSHPTH